MPVAPAAGATTALFPKAPIANAAATFRAVNVRLLTVLWQALAIEMTEMTDRN